MKRVLLFSFAIAFALIIGCAGSKVTVKDNPFNNSKDIELKTWHKVIEGNMDNQEATYIAEIKNGKRTPTTVKFHFRVGAMGLVANPFAKYKDAPLDPTAQILVNDKSYTLKLIDNHKDTTLSITNSYAGTYNDLYCSVVLPSEIGAGIINASKVMYRFSNGGEYTTLLAKPDQLEKLKTFFSIK